MAMVADRDPTMAALGVKRTSTDRVSPAPTMNGVAGATIEKAAALVPPSVTELMVSGALPVLVMPSVLMALVVPLTPLKTSSGTVVAISPTESLAGRRLRAM